MQQTPEPKSVLIVGASRGIGAATAALFAARGDYVTGTHRGSGVPGGVKGFEADVTDEASIQAAVQAAHGVLGKLDIVVVSAGVARQELLIRMTVESVREVFEVNTLGAMMVTKHAAKLMNRQRSGSIVLVSSESARTGIPGSSHYTASKAALEGFMRSAMWEYGPRGIRINTVAPGTTETDMIAPLTPDNRAKMLAATPLGRFAEPEEIADVIYWTANSTFLTGAVIPVTGGEGFGI